MNLLSFILRYFKRSNPGTSSEIPPTGEIIRPDVLRAAKLMERKLKLNDHKAPYSSCRVDYLLLRLAQEYMEFIRESQPWGSSTAKNRNRITDAEAGELIDIMNFSMMLLTKWDGFKFVDFDYEKE
jgi:hypothetical protein